MKQSPGFRVVSAGDWSDDMADAYNKDELNRRMNGAVATLKSEFAGLRTGRASAALLDPGQGRGLWQHRADQPGGHHLHPRSRA